MKKLFGLLLAFALYSFASIAQTTAQDFTQNDCNGLSHQFFTELDSGNVIIIEFIMTCGPCVSAGHAIESMMVDLESQYPGKVRLYQFAYTSSYSCATMDSFKVAGGFNSTTFDQGSHLVAYYGGFGMPTVAIAAGPGHDVLFSAVGFATGDTAYAGPPIRNFLNTVSTSDLPASITSFTSFPNPGNDFVNVKINVTNNSSVELQLIDLSGKCVKDFLKEEVSTGMFEKIIDVSSIANGYYILKASVNGNNIFSKININR